MAKKKNQATMLRTLLLVTAIFAVSALAMAGFLTYYAQATGTVSVQQAVKLEAYDSSGNLIRRVDHTGTIQFSNSGLAGTNIVNGKIGDNDIAYFAINNYASDADAPVNIVVTSKTQEVDEIKFVEYNNGCDPSKPLNLPTTVNRRDKLEFCIVVRYKINTQPGNYEFTVQVVPVTGSSTEAQSSTETESTTGT